MTKKKGKPQPTLKYGKVADESRELLWKDDVELHWRLDGTDTVSFSLPLTEDKRPAVVRGSKLVLTYESEERLVQVLSAQPAQSRAEVMKIEARGVTYIPGVDGRRRRPVSPDLPT